MVANLVNPEMEVTFDNINTLVPDPYKTTVGYTKQQKIARFRKTHEIYEEKFAGSVYLVRDPRSAVVSHYHLQLRGGALQKDDSMDVFVKWWCSCQGGFGGWRKNVDSWLGQPVTVIRYEDLLADTKKMLRVIAIALGITASDAQIKTSVELSSFDNMKAMELGGMGWFDGRAQPEKTGLPFVRLAAIDEWRDTLSEWAVARMEHGLGDVMRRCGYELSS